MYEFIGVDPNKGLEGAGTQHNVNWTTVSRSRIPGIQRVEDGLVYVIKQSVRKLIKDPYDRRTMQTKLISTFRKTKLDFDMEPKTHTELAATYRPHVSRLEEILGRKLDEWEL